MNEDYSYINKKIVEWYLLNKRDLPWRNTKDAYHIWISEIILQQTRVAQGYDYYLRFIKRFPDVKQLAEADEDDVMKLWEGLGYYSRARNLHAAAKKIMSAFAGVFPSSYKDILSLKGIGEYTVAAIASFSFGLPHAVVDGNVYRVLSRLFGAAYPIDSTQGKKYFAELADKLMDKDEPGLYNQAVMEFGALQCVPVSPRCDICPLSDVCIAYAQSAVDKYPVKQGKAKTKERFFNYLDIRCGRFLFLQKRVGNDIWKNLYELPLIETEAAISIEELMKTEAFGNMFEGAGRLTFKSTEIRLKHILSHRIIYARFYRIEVEKDENLSKNYIRVEGPDMDKYAVSRLVHKYFEVTENSLL